MMKNLLLACSILLLAGGHTYASDIVMLEKIDAADYVKLESKVKAQIAKDQNDEFLHGFFQSNQSFDLVTNNVKQFRLIPVSYESVIARNRVCILSVFSPDSQLLYAIKLQYETSDGDEIVGACMGVNAVAFKRQDDQQLLIYLLRYRAGNSYGDTVFIATIKPGKIEKDEQLSECVSANENISTLSKVRKAIDQCNKKSK